MSRQLLSEGGNFHTPALEYRIQYPEPGQPGSASALTATVPIAKPMQMDIAAPQVTTSSMVNAALVDAVFHVGDFQLAIALVHPERTITPAHSLNGEDIGVMEVNLTPLAVVYRTLGGADSFKAKVRDHIFGASGSKRWLFHPRSAAQIRKWSERLHEQWQLRPTPRVENARRGEVVRNMPQVPFHAPTGRPVTFKCKCGETWSPEPGGQLRCPRCTLPAPLNSFIVD